MPARNNNRAGIFPPIFYDRNLIGYDNRKGFLQDYLSRIHYMTKAQFGALGDGRVNPDQIPVW